MLKSSPRKVLGTPALLHVSAPRFDARKSVVKEVALSLQKGSQRRFRPQVGFLPPPRSVIPPPAPCRLTDRERDVPRSHQPDIDPVA